MNYFDDLVPLFNGITNLVSYLIAKDILLEEQ